MRPAPPPAVAQATRRSATSAAPSRTSAYSVVACPSSPRASSQAWRRARRVVMVVPLPGRIGRVTGERSTESEGHRAEAPQSRGDEGHHRQEDEGGQGAAHEREAETDGEAAHSRFEIVPALAPSVIGQAAEHRGHGRAVLFGRHDGVDDRAGRLRRWCRSAGGRPAPTAHRHRRGPPPRRRAIAAPAALVAPRAPPPVVMPGRPNRPRPGGPRHREGGRAGRCRRRERRAVPSPGRRRARRPRPARRRAVPS